MTKANWLGTLITLLLTVSYQSQASDSVHNKNGRQFSSIKTGKTASITTFERLYHLASAGDPDYQNVIGFMYFNGEAVTRDYEKAHSWFHLSAEQGNLLAQRNLGLFHSRALSRIPEEYLDPMEANIWFSLVAAGTPGESVLASDSYTAFLQPEKSIPNPVNSKQDIGKTIYVTFCAGCHGFEGQSAYPGAPSFAFGDQLTQTDTELIASISSGKGMMPAWDKTLSAEEIRYVLSYIRRDINKTAITDDISKNSALQDRHKPVENNRHTGEAIYAKFCSGCHGFNGIAYYVNSPSFALRERMEKSDSELAYSIINGKGIMPSWEMMLSGRDIDSLVDFIRTLAPSYESGIGREIRLAPELYYIFRPWGETGDEWNGGDVR